MVFLYINKFVVSARASRRYDASDELLVWDCGSKVNAVYPQPKRLPSDKPGSSLSPKALSPNPIHEEIELTHAGYPT